MTRPVGWAGMSVSSVNPSSQPRKRPRRRLQATTCRVRPVLRPHHEVKAMTTNKTRIHLAAVVLAGLSVTACTAGVGDSVQLTQAGGTPAAARTSAATRPDAPALRSEIERRLAN